MVISRFTIVAWPRPGFLNIGILVGEGMSISPGFYLFDTCRRRLGRLAAGHLMEAMATACLDQIS
jgi:hypothetical protein